MLWLLLLLYAADRASFLPDVSAFDHFTLWHCLNAICADLIGR